MYEIMNSMVKEMKIIHAKQIEAQAQAHIQAHVQSSEQTDHSPAFSPSMPFGGAAGGLFPPELFRLFQMGSGSRDDSYEIVEGEDEYEDDNDDEEQEFKKIVVSDTELSDEEEEDGNDNNVKVINISEVIDIDMGEPQPLMDLEEEDIVLDDLVPEGSQEGEQEEQGEQGEQYDQQNSPEESGKMDYRKMDVSYLRTMVLTRGLAMDTKKLKKSELIRLLEQSTDL